MKRRNSSAMDNIAEGFERGGTKNLFNFYTFQKAQLLKPDLNYVVLWIMSTFLKENLKVLMG